MIIYETGNPLMIRLYWPEGRCSEPMRPNFLNVQVGDVVAVNQPGEKPYRAKALYVEGGARTADPTGKILLFTLLGEAVNQRLQRQ